MRLRTANRRRKAKADQSLMAMMRSPAIRANCATWGLSLEALAVDCVVQMLDTRQSMISEIGRAFSLTPNMMVQIHTEERLALAAERWDQALTKLVLGVVQP